MDQRNVVVLAEQATTSSRLALPHQPVIDEHAGQLLADRFVDQTAATEESTPPDSPQITLLFADLLADRSIALRGRPHGPVGWDAGDFWTKLRQQLGAVGRVHHFGMEHRRRSAPARWRSRRARFPIGRPLETLAAT